TNSVVRYGGNTTTEYCKIRAWGVFAKSGISQKSKQFVGYQNWHKDEVQLGGKVTLLRHGVIVTNVIDTGAGISSQGITNPKPNIAVGIPAYVGRGAITSGGTAQGWLTTGPPLDERGELGRFDVEVRYRVGTFLSTRDEDGYAKVEINLP
ncbi:hypothetical protein LCGC14_1632630, partial [marine sediment metagenome]